MKSRIDETLTVSNARTEWNALGKLLGFIGQLAFYALAFYGAVIGLSFLVGN